MNLVIIFNIGDTGYDKVTGYSGTITALTVQMKHAVFYLVEDIDDLNRPVAKYLPEVRLDLYDEKEEDNNDKSCDGNCEKFISESIHGMDEFLAAFEDMKEKNINKNIDKAKMKETDPVMNNKIKHNEFNYGVRKLNPDELARLLHIIFGI